MPNLIRDRGPTHMPHDARMPNPQVSRDRQRPAVKRVSERSGIPSDHLIDS
jgi:hypothetical protein